MGSKVTVKGRRRRSLALALVVAIVAGTGYAATTAAGKSKAEPVTLTISLFGDFGYHDLYKQYEASHPGVTIKESIQDFAVHHSNLAKSVATGAGAADVEAIEVGFIAQFKAQPTRFVNLRQYGAGALKNRWLNWKWAQGLGSKGEIVGLGTGRLSRSSGRPGGRSSRPESGSRRRRRRASPSSTPAATSTTR